MQACIVNFRGGRHTKYDNQMIVKVEKVDTRKAAEKLLNKQLLWLTPAGREIKGKIVNLHGNKGAVRVHFEKGMPGQAVGTQVKVE